jgi:hypothetical protein
MRYLTTIQCNKPLKISSHGWNISLSDAGYGNTGVMVLEAVFRQAVLHCFPTKGLSVGQLWYNQQPVFWEAPAGLIPPGQFNPLQEDICINGKVAPGFSFLKTFASGIELYGLKNWGMPRKDPDGKLLPLHGETSNIPVKEIELWLDNNDLIILGTFEYRSFRGDEMKPWYERGDVLYMISRTIRISNAGKIEVSDTIENQTGDSLSPDWGYHITFHAEEGAKLLVPSQSAEIRGEGNLPADIETWKPQTREDLRTETGIIHKKVRIIEKNSRKLNYVLVRYPNGKGIWTTFTPLPYFQTWFCNGGANSDEFTYTNGEPVFQKPWNGIGIEIGASALDHDGRTDSSVSFNPVLLPGQAVNLVIGVEVLDHDKTLEMEKEISMFNSNNRKPN